MSTRLNFPPVLRSVRVCVWERETGEKVDIGYDRKDHKQQIVSRRFSHLQSWRLGRLLLQWMGVTMPLMHSTVSIRQVCKCIDRFIDSLRLEVTSLTEHFGCQIKISTISALELLIIRPSFRRFYYQFVSWVNCLEYLAQPLAMYFCDRTTTR